MSEIPAQAHLMQRKKMLSELPNAADKMKAQISALNSDSKMDLKKSTTKYRSKGLLLYFRPHFSARTRLSPRQIQAREEREAAQALEDQAVREHAQALEEERKAREAALAEEEDEEDKSRGADTDFTSEELDEIFAQHTKGPWASNGETPSNTDEVMAQMK